MLTTDDKYSLLNRDNLRQPIQIQFLKSELNFEHFQTKMLVIADVFPKLWNPKKVVNQISKKFPFIPLFGKQHVRGTKHCLNLGSATFTIIIDDSEGI